MVAPIRGNQENYVVHLTYIFAVLCYSTGLSGYTITFIVLSSISVLCLLIRLLIYCCASRTTPATRSTAVVTGNSFHNVAAVNRETAPPSYDESQIKV
ncbi:unnamed protein product [Didymodactylos carnosus]|uniref:Uncharacterized protein n=1 Tax=Didymodactylos carnosus TaxID=1234261 RepID=A0A815Z6N0_9BILA|nr:unnamed protein product [Didymodactylos carnosus]CAF4447020.1 unnamed protein product [Didymodactylos carnosus]